MRRKVRSLVCLSLTFSLVSVTAWAGGVKSPTWSYCSYVLQTIHKVERQLSQMAAVAQEVTGKLSDGASLYVAGSDRGFDLEAINRAGGPMITKLLPTNEQVKSGDVVMLSFTSQNIEADRELAARLTNQGAMVIGFGSPKHGGSPDTSGRVACLFDNFAPEHDCILKVPGYDEPLGPTTALGNAINLWAFNAELVSACTRRGKMLTMWQSVMVPGSKERNQKYIGRNFHDNLHIAPIPAGVLGKMYLTRLAHAVEQIRSAEGRNIQRAARQIVSCLQRGKGAYLYIIGHMPPDEVGRYGDPKYFKPLPYGKQLTEIEKTVTRDDMVVGLVYTGIWPELLNFVNDTGAPAIWIVAPTDDTQKALSRGDLVIDQHWVLGDAIVDVPGYDVKILPPSAVTQLTIYWSLVGEIAEMLHQPLHVAH